MRFQQHINESNNVTDLISRLIQMGYRKAEKELQGSTKTLIQHLMDIGMADEALLIVNKHLRTNFKSLKDLGRKHRIAIREGDEMLNEDLKHLWKFVESQAWGGIVFYPILQMYMELDRLLSGSGFDVKKTLVYASVFLFVMSAKHLQLFKKWKKESPVEWEMEGRPRAFFGKQGLSADAKKYIQQGQEMAKHPDHTKTTGKLGFTLRR